MKQLLDFCFMRIKQISLALKYLLYIVMNKLLNVFAKILIQAIFYYILVSFVHNILQQWMFKEMSSQVQTYFILQHKS